MLPSTAQLVMAADGTALTPFRVVIDATRPHMPADFGCVLDAALTSESVALGHAPRIGTTIVIHTRAHVACPALSKIAEHTYVATIGASTVAARASSILESPHWVRSRPYLLRDPIAFAIDRPGAHYIAVAQPDPIDAWLSIDARDPAAIERDINAWLERQKKGGLVELANSITVQTRGTQLLVNTSKLSAEELAQLVGELLRASDAPPRVAAQPAFACPQLDDNIRACSGDGRHYTVASLAAALRQLADSEPDPLVAGGDITGLRFTQDPEYLLRTGDVLLGVDSHRVVTVAQLRDLARHVRDHMTVAVRRDGVDVILELRELPQ